MKEMAIQVNNLTKVYKMYDKPVDRMKEALHPLRRRYHRDFYALRDVSFSVRKGEAIGILGRNGSGKSTLLKIISKVLTPTSGEVLVNGKVAALLELGAGFNVEMSGMENVYLSGMLMGYSRQEMNEKLDEIVSFADIGDHIYQPVKTYSSGMLVRLAFAVQTQVEPDILIVDEALAVGDALFQKRCFQKMEALINQGTTLLFVSHDQEMIRTMTQRAVLLLGGEVALIGTSADVVIEYRKQLHEEERKYFSQMLVNQKNKSVKINEGEARREEIDKEMSIKMKRVDESIIKHSKTRSFGDLDAEILSAEVLDSNNNPETCFYPGENIRIKVICKINKPIKNISLLIRLRNKEGIRVYSWGTLNQDMAIKSGWRRAEEIIWDKEFKAGQIIEAWFEMECVLGANLYEVQAAVSHELDPFYGSQRMLHWRDEVAFFQVNLRHKEYVFTGVCDLKMHAQIVGNKDC